MLRSPDLPHGMQKLQTAALCSGSATAYELDLGRHEGGMRTSGVGVRLRSICRLA
jgi:hypothetical protein